MRCAKSIPPLLLGLIAGCTVGPKYQPPTVTVLPEFGNAGREPSATLGSTTRPSRITSSPPPVEWWRTFRDDKLDGLIAQAVERNLDLQQAAYRVREARAARDIAAGRLLPTIDGDASYTHVRASQNGVAGAFGGAGGAGGGTPVNVGGGGAAAPGANGSAASPSASLGEFNLYQANFDAAWEIDLFGRNRRAVEAASALVDAAIELRRDTMVTLLGEVARNYIDLRAGQRRLDIAKANLASQQKTLDITRQRVEQGLANRLDYSRAQAQVATTASQIPMLETTAAQAIHRLSTLVDERPTALAAELNVATPLPPTPDAVPVGLPADLLRRRPDVRRAERQLASATAAVGVAVAELYPQINLTGSLGLQSLEIKDLVDYPSRFYSFGPAVTIPIFQGGRLRANVRLQDARDKEASLAFRSAVLTALREVEDALVAYAKSQERVKHLRTATLANEESVNIATDLYNRGVGDFLDVLDAQRQLFAAQDTLATVEGEVDTSLVALYKALGGGWELSPDVPSEAKPTPRIAVKTQG